MPRYTIKDEAYHEAELEKLKAARRAHLASTDYEEETGLSMWASDALRAPHDAALEAWHIGREAGLGEPGVEGIFLFDAKGRPVNAEPETTAYGKIEWVLASDEAAVLGRKTIPFLGNYGEASRRSKIQDSLGLTERVTVLPSDRSLTLLSTGRFGPARYTTKPRFPGVPKRALEEKRAEKAAEKAAAQSRIRLVDAAGRTVTAQLKEGQWGPYWHLSPQEEAIFGKRFVPSGPKKTKVRDELGLREVEVSVGNPGRRRGLR
jgi:hypothetical protein